MLTFGWNQESTSIRLSIVQLDERFKFNQIGLLILKFQGNSPLKTQTAFDSRSRHILPLL